MADEVAVVEQQQSAPNTEGSVDTQQQQQAPEFTLDGIDDSILTKHLAKKLGMKDLKSLDDLKPAPPKPSKEEVAQQEEEETRSAYAWALGTGKIKKEHYEQAIKEKGKTPREISLSRFAEEMREIDPKFSDEDIEELYKDTYYEGEQDDSPRKKLAAKRIEREAAEHLSKFKDVDEIVEAYRSHHSNETRQKTYSKSVKETIKSLPRELEIEVPYTDEKGEEKIAKYKVPVEDKVFSNIAKIYDNPDMFNVLGLNDAKTELPEDYLATALKSDLERLTAPSVLAKVVKEHTDFRIKDLEARLKGFTDKAPATPGAVKQNTAAKSTYDEAVAKQRQSVSYR